MDAGKQMNNQKEAFINATEVSFTSITGAHALGHFSTPLAVLLAHAVLGPLERVSVVAGECQFSSLHIWDSQFLPVCWRCNVPTRRHCAGQDTAQHSEPERSQRSGDASASLTRRQSLHERNVTLERSSGSISHRRATTHQDVIPTQQRNPLASTHWIDKSPQSQQRFLIIPTELWSFSTAYLRCLVG